MTKALSFKIISIKWLLCVFLCLLWCDRESNAQSTLETNPTTIISTTMKPPENIQKLSVIQQERNITLTWDKVDNISTYYVDYMNGDVSISHEANSTYGNTVTYVATPLTPGTYYTFTVITTSNRLNSTRLTVSTFTLPRNAEDFKATDQNETSITLQWTKVENNIYILSYGTNEETFTVTDNVTTVTISSLNNTTEYEFTLYTEFNTSRSSGVSLTAYTAPLNPDVLETLDQNETSITLRWNKVGNLSYVLEFNGTEENITAADKEDPVTHTVSGLESGTKYNYTLFTVFENVRSSGLTESAPTAPRNPEGLLQANQNETSITLQWNNVGNLSYVLDFNGKEENITAPAGQDPVTYTVSSLESGTKYDYTLFTVFENVRSSGLTESAATAPLNPDVLETVDQTETSITLRWNKVGNLSYVLRFDGEEENITAPAGQDPVTHTVSGLESGTKYNYTLFTVFENIRSSGLPESAATAPLNPDVLETVDQTETSITLRWNKVGNLSYVLRFDGEEENITAPAGQDPVTHTVSGLESGTKYNYTLFTVFENIRSSGLPEFAATVPSKVAVVSVVERTVDSLTLEWNNVKTDWNYTLQINGGANNLQSSEDVVSHRVSSLKPGTEYNFNVITEFFGFRSDAYEDFTVTTIDCASVPWQVTNSSISGTVEGLFSKATAKNHTNTQINLESTTVLFTDLYPGDTYDISLEYEKESKTFDQCSHTLTINPPDLKANCQYRGGGYSLYIVWDKPAGVWTSVEVKTAITSLNVTGSEEQNVEIGGAQPAKTYEVSVATRSGPVRKSTPYVFQCKTDPRGVIAGSVIGVLIFVILVCLVAFILLRRPDIIRKNKPFNGGSKQTDKKPKAIPVERFPEHFYQLSMDKNRAFSEEYESLMPIGTEQTQKEAILEENKPKNRYTNVLPYDWCRVKLTATDGRSDYINASYMPGYNSSREFIAAQGPLPSTVSEFWRMIWEQKVKGIVMVTNCRESGKTKCEQYWPGDKQPCVYGELRVTIRSEQTEHHWTLREFTVKHTRGSEERTVKHFHFTAWPDHGVPQGTEDLIQFRELIRQHINREGTGAPTVVHCSAGVGRTGTIIALDTLLQQLEKEQAVGINAFVHKMRLNRPHMVQTESQYVFLHQCIMDILQQNEEPEEPIYENDIMYVNATAMREFQRNGGV